VRQGRGECAQPIHISQQDISNLTPILVMGKRVAMSEAKGFLSRDAGSIVFPLILGILLLIFSVEYVNLDNTVELMGADEITEGGHDAQGQHITIVTDSFSGQILEGGKRTHEIAGNKDVMEFKAVLLWTDEADEFPMTNQPDTFNLSIKTPSGTIIESSQVSNPQGGEGVIELSLNISKATNGEMSFEEGPWTIVVKCLDSGDQEGVVLSSDDSGNAYQLSLVYTVIGGES